MEAYLNRRQRLIQNVSDNSVVILPNNKEFIRNRDINYPYRPDSNFYYLTGFKEPDSLAVITRDRFVLFARPHNPEQEQWDGYRAGLDGLKKIFGASQSYDISDLDKHIKDLLEGSNSIYISFSCNYDYKEKIFSWINGLQREKRINSSPTTIKDLDPILSEMRLIKDKWEIELLRTACKISAEAHKQTMQIVKTSRYEYELDAILKYTFAKKGALEVAYPNIVASGANTCILHYVENNAKIDPNGLVLIDAGAEYGFYASDITRTFPANGKFNGEQKAIYNLVLKAQTETINLVKPGVNWGQLINKTREILTRGLVELGIIENNTNETISQLVEKKAYLPFYMHGHGHWMGLDVHDVGSYLSSIKEGYRVLEEGMVFTVEPGIYIKHGLENVDPKWYDIGVRIEDDILVTRDGYEILTSDVPKTIEEIEKLIT